VKGKDFGVITVAFSAAGHLALLPKMINPFRRRFPNMRLKVVEGTFPVLETDIRDGIIDLYYGAVSRGASDPALVVDTLFENKRIIVARPGHPLGKATTLAALAGASWVAAPVAIDSDSEVNSLFEGEGLPAPHIAMQAATCMSLLSIIAASDLLAPLPQQWIDFIDSTHLVERIPIQKVQTAPRICAVRRANIPLTPAAAYLNDLALRAATVHLRERRPI
jgi:DNA-binding transcriptional LysR family regulator